MEKKPVRHRFSIERRYLCTRKVKRFKVITQLGTQEIPK